MNVRAKREENRMWVDLDQAPFSRRTRPANYILNPSRYRPRLLRFPGPFSAALELIAPLSDDTSPIPAPPAASPITFFNLGVLRLCVSFFLRSLLCNSRGTKVL